METVKVKVHILMQSRPKEYTFPKTTELGEMCNKIFEDKELLSTGAVLLCERKLLGYYYSLDKTFGEYEEFNKKEVNLHLGLVMSSREARQNILTPLHKYNDGHKSTPEEENKFDYYYLRTPP